MKGILFIKIGMRYTVGIIHKNSYYHIAFKKKFKIIFKCYRNQANLVLEHNCYFIGFIKI